MENPDTYELKKIDKLKDRSSAATLLKRDSGTGIFL